MAKKTLEETNKTYEKIVNLLKNRGVQISHPIVVNTSNIDKDAWISCNYMGTGVHIALDEIDFNDFNGVDPEIMRHCRTWSYIDNMKK